MRSLRCRVLICLFWTLLFAPAAADDWPQWRGSERDGIWRETGIVDRFAGPEIETRWRQPIGAGYCGPTVADGRVYVMDRHQEPEQIERVLCFDAKSGASLWSHPYACKYVGIGYQAGPRASVTVEDGRAFALGAMGHFHCLDAGSGLSLWKKDLNEEYGISADDRMPIWGIAAAPLVYDDLVIVHIGGKENASIVAFDKEYGDEKWRQLRDRAQYSAPIIIQQAGRDVLVCWTADSIAGLDPTTGDVYWRFPFAPRNMPIGIATPIVSGDRLFVTSFYDGALMLRLASDRPDVELLWRRNGRSEQETEALQSIISTPFFQGDYLYGVDSYGELRCLQASDGERVWEDLTATPKGRWSTIHFVQHEERVWMFNERGELIIARLSPGGFQELSRAKLIDPTLDQLAQRNGVCWSHPAYADRHIFARNDKELVCADLAAD